MAARHILLPVDGSVAAEAAARCAPASAVFSNSREGLRILVDSLAGAAADHG